MTFWKSYARAPLAVRALTATVITLAVFAVPAPADRWVFAHVYHERLYDLDWARFLREMGWWPSWAIAALALWLHRRGADPAAARRGALLLAGSPALGGILCEVMKLLIRRERPELGGGEWIVRAWDDQTFSTAGLATPSSHTMVAFAGATMAARLFPGARTARMTIRAMILATRKVRKAHR